ncbi:MAG: copper chaperone PCu(A)C [Woeseiaceae bacterium]|nr:copper chaperone PCu(A)C [Woeseiaceae bacterium]
MTCRLFCAAKIRALVCIGAALIFLAACDAAQQPPLGVADVIVREPLPGSGNTAAYMTLVNNSDIAIEITSVSSPQFAHVEMHETLVSENIARMRPISRLQVPRRSKVIFEPGGKHIMMMQPLGSPSTVTLNFHAGAEILLTVTTTLEAR